MRYFVTGATGFIGRRLVNALLGRRGSTAHFLLRPGSEDRVAERLKYWGASGARAIPVSGDLTAKTETRRPAGRSSRPRQWRCSS